MATRRHKRDCGHLCCPIRRNMWHRHIVGRGKCKACRAMAATIRAAAAH